MKSLLRTFLVRSLVVIGGGSSTLACGGSSAQTTSFANPDSGAVPPGDDDAGAQPDSSGSIPVDASHPVADANVPDANVSYSYPNDPGDGPPTRQTCTSTFGTGASITNGTHGRLDGTLVSIVQPADSKSCNDDTTHLHLQIEVAGAVYDVAMNMDTLYLEKDMPLMDGTFAEGWHGGMSVDYPSLGLDDTQFTLPSSDPNASITDLAAILTGALENANHVSVFAMGYGPTGIHDVHRETAGEGHDGALVIDPLEPTSHVFFFCFNTDTF
jgi:hypothetical protein